MKTKRLILAVWALAMGAAAWAQGAPATVAEEGAWCWFADPRAVYDREADKAYVGYIDVHGAVKATQVDYRKGRTEEVLVRSFFQPDDHNNPTFLRLPDGRVMIFYTRHTDDPHFYYRISTRPGDITRLGEERTIDVDHNTTYPSPFILSDDPDHIWLCWRGLGWHPTIARLTMPDADDRVRVVFGPKQMVQSTGARPYAKYQSNGKDKIYVAYTTGHPDNEYPNWLYFNVIRLNGGERPQLCDLRGNVLSDIGSGKFPVAKTEDYALRAPATLVDAPQGWRDWVWQIALDGQERPAVAFTRISQDKRQHLYFYARWTGDSWRVTELGESGGQFHGSNTEHCYSGGMAIDPADPRTVYASMKTDGVWEIWKYRIAESGAVEERTAVTAHSAANNVRPYVLPGSEGKDLRLCWMHGEYDYWLVCRNYPQGYTNSIQTSGRLPREKAQRRKLVADVSPGKPLPKGRAKTFTLRAHWTQDDLERGGTLLRLGGLEYGIDAQTLKPYAIVNGQRHDSQNTLGTSDAWATQSNGTDGRWYLQKLTALDAAFDYDGKTLTIYRNGLIDQRIDAGKLRITN